LAGLTLIILLFFKNVKKLFLQNQKKKL